MLTDVLNFLGGLAVERVRKQLIEDDKVVTKETYNSIRYEITSNGVEVRAKKSILTLIFGRGATKNDGDGDLRKRIEIWARIRGIPKNAVGAIVRSIHEKGTQVPNRYTDGKLLIRAFDGFQDDIRKELNKVL